MVATPGSRVVSRDNKSLRSASLPIADKGGKSGYHSRALTHSLAKLIQCIRFIQLRHDSARLTARSARSNPTQGNGQPIACNCICRSNKSKLSPPGGSWVVAGQQHSMWSIGMLLLLLPHRVASRGRGFQLHFGYTIRSSRHCFMAWLLASSLQLPSIQLPGCHATGRCH